jgi:uncharacterized protein (TIGR02145 family)
MRLLFLFIVVCIIPKGSFSQTPGSFPFQAIIRNQSSQAIVNQYVNLRFGLYQNSLNTLLWQEIQSVETNNMGLINVILGAQNPFSNIDWESGNKLMKIEVDFGQGYTLIAVQAINSVPFSLESGNGFERISMSGDSLILSNSEFLIIPGVSSTTYGPRIVGLSCENYENSGELMAGAPAADVKTVITYEFGNGAIYQGRSFSSTGVTGLQAILSDSVLSLGPGRLMFGITGTPASLGQAQFDIELGGQSCTFYHNVDTAIAVVESINCTESVHQGILYWDSTAVGVESFVPYIGGNGAIHESLVINSTGVTGLVATLDQGQLAQGNGSLHFVISGAPNSIGTANFEIILGGVSCSFSREVVRYINSLAVHSCGAPDVHNVDLYYGSMLDQQGNSYKTIVIGGQEWMAENLKVSSYRNGDPIVTGLSNSAWNSTSTGAWAFDNNDPTTICPHGGIYNWYACVDSRNLCPTGWRIPSNSDWLALANSLGGMGGAGGKMKATGTIIEGTGYWVYPNNEATNSSGFSGLAGYYYNGFGEPGYSAYWWSSNQVGVNDASYSWSVNAYGASLDENWDDKNNGFSVRCIRDCSNCAVIGDELICDDVVDYGSLTSGIAAFSVSTRYHYSGANNGAYPSITVPSTGVLGLSATLPQGMLTGSGNLTFTITGSPQQSGLANFAFTIGGKTCNLQRLVLPPSGISGHSCGASGIHNPTYSYGSMVDQEGNIYRTIIIGSQEWMAENLNTSIYRNGDTIRTNLETSGSNISDYGGWTYFNGDSTYECPFGKLYNWYACVDSRSLCPVGWHVPSDQEWTVLTDILGGLNSCGGKLKEVGILSDGTGYWDVPNTGATNFSGFAALPGGSKFAYITGYADMNDVGYWWSTSVNTNSSAWIRTLYSTSNAAGRYSGFRVDGFSVRCLKD